jgi:CRISPR-associated protein Cst2
MLLIKDYLKRKLSEGEYLDTEELSQKLDEFSKIESKEIKTADYINYNQVVNELIEEIFKEA